MLGSPRGSNCGGGGKVRLGKADRNRGPTIEASCVRACMKAKAPKAAKTAGRRKLSEENPGRVGFA